MHAVYGKIEVFQGEVMPRIKHNMDGSETVRFNLDDTLEHNFNAYQDALEKYPDSFSSLKLRYDQYLKTVPLYSKEMDVEEGLAIEFGVVS